MSSTRHAQDGAELSQERYASSPALANHGLKANDVARRCATLKTEKELLRVWYMQARSHQDNGVAGLVAELVEDFRDQICPPSLVNFKGDKHRKLSPDTVRAWRRELHGEDCFLLRGEFTNRQQQYMENRAREDAGEFCEPVTFGADAILKEYHTQSANRPESYTAADFFTYAESVARRELGAFLTHLLIDPAQSFTAPWYFPELFECIDALMEKTAAAMAATVPRTSVGDELEQAIRYARKTKSMVLFCGPQGTGKSTQAQCLCAQYPALCRYVMAPQGNTRREWFRNFLDAYLTPRSGLKANVLQERAEHILEASGVVPVIDDALYALPNHERDANPDRLDWVVTLADRGIGCVLITSPDFYTRLQGIAQRSRWTGKNFLERAFPWPAPDALTDKEIELAARDMLPAAKGDSIFAAVAITRKTGFGSLHFLAKIRNCAVVVAEGNGRGEADVNADDIRDALNKYIRPSTQRHAEALAAATAELKKRKSGRMVERQPEQPAPAREHPAEAPRVLRGRAALATRETAPAGVVISDD